MEKDKCFCTKECCAAVMVRAVINPVLTVCDRADGSIDDCAIAFYTLC